MSNVRQFVARDAVREQVPVLVGLMGASGSGKTYSALRLATGIQRISGGDIAFIDTESRRALHYADQFRFKHIEFGQPFSPMDYLAAIEFAHQSGAKTIVVDSMSHEHEGPGGVLEMHDVELARLGGRDSDSFRAWSKPKAERRRMVNSILQINANFIFCFRAKEKTKPGKDATGRKALIEQGYMPIAGEEFVFEMTMNALLMPGSAGVPVWQSEFPGERAMMKLPRQFADLMAKSRPLDEDTGQALAEWARGKLPAPELSADEIDRLDRIEARGAEAAEMGEDAKKAWWASLDKRDQELIRARRKLAKAA
jgi:hypothetical protein